MNSLQDILVASYNKGCNLFDLKVHITPDGLVKIYLSNESIIVDGMVKNDNVTMFNYARDLTE